jgi:hypothetical protein
MGNMFPCLLVSCWPLHKPGMASIIECCLREVGVKELLSIASRKLMKTFVAWTEEELAIVMRIRKRLEITKNSYPLAKSGFLPLVVL